MGTYFEEEEPISSSYILRHWRGDLSLPVAYWVNAVFISVLIPILLSFLVSWAEQAGSSIQLTSAAMMLILMLNVIVTIWAIVGTWRSADRHIERGGRGIWEAIAKFLMLLSAFRLFGGIVTLGPYMAETSQLALGNDPMGEPAKIELVDNTIKVAGPLSLGTAQRFAQIVEANPEAKRVVLTSIGGRIGEAFAMSKLVADRSLNTTASTECSSACTIVLVAGRDRSATPRTKIGFHEPSYPGMATGQMNAMSSLMADAYRDAGVADNFANEALRVSADSMWYPDEPELFKAGVLNLMDPERIAFRFKVEARNFQRQLPKKIDELTTLVSVVADGQTITYRYIVDLPPGLITASEARKKLINDLKSDLCSQYLLPEYLRSGGRYDFTYNYRGGGTLTQFSIDAC